MAQLQIQYLAIIGHGNWDMQTRFTVPYNINLYYFYPAESGTSLCYSPADVPVLCRKDPVDVRRENQQAPDFSITGGVGGLVNGVRNCIVGSQFAREDGGKSAMLVTFNEGTSYRLSEVVNFLSQGLAQTGQYAIIRMMLCGGGNNMMHAVSGVSLSEPEALREMHRRNAEKAYNTLISLGLSQNKARVYAQAIYEGKSLQQAELEMNQVAGRKRRSTRRRRTRTKRISSHKSKTR